MIEDLDKETVIEYLAPTGKASFAPAAIRSCYGDLVLICQVLDDYARLCEEY